MASGPSRSSSRPLSLSIPSRRSSNTATNFMESTLNENEKGRELFEACRTGDVARVRSLIQGGWPVNMRDTAGRKSTPLHFAAGLYLSIVHFDSLYILIVLNSVT